MLIFDVNGVRAERKRLRLPLQTAAKMTDIGASRLSRFERKVARLPSHEVLRLQYALHICQLVAFQREPPHSWEKLASEIRRAVDSTEREAASAGLASAPEKSSS